MDLVIIAVCAYGLGTITAVVVREVRAFIRRWRDRPRGPFIGTR